MNYKIKWHPVPGPVTITIPDHGKRTLGRVFVGHGQTGAVMVEAFDAANRVHIVPLDLVVDEAERERLEQALKEAEGGRRGPERDHIDD